MSRMLLMGALVCAVIAVSPPAALAQSPDVDEVVTLSAAGVSDDDIIARMKANGAVYALSIDEVLRLTEAGVSERVLGYMLSTAPSTGPEAPAEPPPQYEDPGRPVTLASLADLISMHEEGATETEMIAAIERSAPLRVTRDELEVLRAVGVPEPVVVAAVKRSLANPRPTRRDPPPPGGRHARTRDRRPPPARQQPKRGFQVITGVGANWCLADGAAGCEDIGPGVALNLSAGYRVNRYFSVALDFGYGTLSFDEEGAAASTISVKPTLRGHFPAGPLEFHLGLGGGYASTSAEAFASSRGKQKVTWSTPLALKLTTGLTASVTQSIGLGVGFDVFIHPNAGELCITNPGDPEICGTIGDDAEADISERFTMTFLAVFVL